MTPDTPPPRDPAPPASDGHDTEARASEPPPNEASSGVTVPAAAPAPSEASEPEPADASVEAPSASPVERPAPPEPPRARRSFVAEREEAPVDVPRRTLVSRSRRDFLLFGLGVAATAVGAWWLLPERTKARLLPGPARERLDTLAARVGLTRARRERTLDRSLTFDDDVAEALYSPDRRVRTYARSQVTPLRNNYAGQTPGREYLAGWTLTLSGLASGRSERLALDDLLHRFTHHEQVTRLVCVEGWSAIAWWGGLRFADLLDAYPPMPGARWAALRSTVNLDAAGRPDPYYVSIDLPTARHPQTLLATRLDERPLGVAHGAPLRLLVPMKLGLKNIKAITQIAYGPDEPPDYWNEQGYSRYDGL